MSNYRVISICCSEIYGFQGYQDEWNISQIYFITFKQKDEAILEYLERFPTELKCYVHVCVAAETVRMKDLAAACLSRVVIAILRNFVRYFSRVTKSTKKFYIFFIYIVLKNITSRYLLQICICFVVEIGAMPDVEVKPPKRVPN